ncbi:hypothetical protein CGGC5_v010472 [Colletotrichum fructicola Nara gc5]|uniref:Xylanolytic transcriptional activator regulatory domain-containing protein n=2 Tax=Colletotrichum fructicola (strain Nara gc5) TaxID=1213859 RepID=A0A7J6IWJ8_COLFN|nr:hypothetical protein CGGC5_v010472 [Colletotrichum fructicola Nara gc5]
MSSASQREPRLACLYDFECVYKSRQQRPGLRAGYVSRLEQQLEAMQARLERIEDYLMQGSHNMPFNIERTPVSLPSADNGQLESDPSDPSDPDLAEVSGDVTQDVLEAVPQSHTNTLDTESPMQSATLMLPTANEGSGMFWQYASDYSLIQISKGMDSIVQEEARRAFWMVEMLDAISTLGLPHSMPYSPSPFGASLPCLESQWSSTPTVIERSDSEPRYASGFALCIMLSVEELKVVREFLGRSYDLDKLDQRLDWQSEAQRLDERLTNWREEFVAAVFQLINYEKGHLPRGEMESFFTLTNCILNEAIIVLLQQMAPMPKGIETTFGHWAFATTRCTYACENLTAKVRRIGADQLERESPYLISPLFVAARFYIVYSKALDADVPANLHTLAFFLHACGKRWPLAQLYETIIRTAVAEHRSPISECVLPVEFYDFRYTTLEITELLQSAGTKLT